MNIVLIDPFGGQAHGLKSISSYLKLQGHQVKLIFLRSKLVEQINKPGSIYRYDKEVIKEILNQCAGVDLVGITVVTNAFDMAEYLTREIKNEPNINVMWGGVHPTIRPEECLQHADMVCIGEGEISLSELLKNMEIGSDITNVQGIWFKRNGQIIKNPIRDPIENLDSLPIEDLNIHEHLLLNKGRLIHLDQRDYYNKGQYSVRTSRGCYFNCSFCANSYLRKLYKNKNYLRKRSIPHFINELKQVKSRYDNIKRIFFDDDSFLIRPVEEIELFKEMYKREINLPFFCLAIPKNIQKEKIELLVSAGMDTIQFGIQSTTPRILDLYNRKCYKEDVFASSKIVKEVSKNKVFIHYDLILDNPYEKEAELTECLRFLMTLPRPYTINYFRLVFFPGLELTEIAKKDGLLSDEMKFVYRKSYNVPRASYINALFYLMKFFGARKVTGFLMTVLLNKNIIKLLNNKFTTTTLELISRMRTKIKYG